VPVLEDVYPAVFIAHIGDCHLIEIAIASGIVVVGRQTESSGLHHNCPRVAEIEFAGWTSDASFVREPRVDLEPVRPALAGRQ
jgi:hypothetical protein